MDKLIFELSIDGKKILIEAPYIQKNIVQLESYAPLPESLQTRKPIFAKDSDELKEDLTNLAPNSLDGSPFDNTVDSFRSTLQQHINNYGQLLPADLFAYIDETIFLIFNISEQTLGESLDRKDGEQYFKVLFKIVWEYFLPQDLKERFNEVGKQEPYTSLIVQSLFV